MCRSRLNTVVFFIVGDSDGVGDDSEDGDGDGDEDEGEEEVPENADEVVTEVVEGEEEEDEGEKQEAGDGEFIDKENESQFCLESNFMGEGEEEDAESPAELDNKGEEGVNFY